MKPASRIDQERQKQSASVCQVNVTQGEQSAQWTTPARAQPKKLLAYSVGVLKALEDALGRAPRAPARVGTLIAKIKFDGSRAAACKVFLKVSGNVTL